MTKEEKPKKPASSDSGKKEIKKDGNKLKEAEDLLKRTQADFVNYRNRMETEKVGLIKYGATTTVMKIVPVLDNFSLALSHTPEDLKNNSWVQGVQYIQKQLEDILREEGVERVETKGEFNHNFHEAVGFEENKDKKDGDILSEVESGYRLGEKILKPAKVIVNKLNK